MKSKTQDWDAKAKRAAKKLVDAGLGMSGLKKLCKGAETWRYGIHLVGTTEMTRLNSFYRKKTYATDVLSFSAPAPFQRDGYLGDLVICVPVMKRQALEMGHSPEQELRILLVHGMLHLLGLDHERGDRQAAEMRRWEKKLLEAAFPTKAAKRAPGGGRPVHRGLIERSS